MRLQRGGDAISTETTHQESRLMKLPAELRNLIYELVVVEAKTIDIVDPDHVQGGPGVSERAKQPGIAQVCRQLRREVLPIFYSQNTFRVNACGYWYLSHAERNCIWWITRLRDSSKALVRNIRICTFACAASMIEGWNNSLLVNGVQDRICGDTHYNEPWRTAGKSTGILDGWTWVGDAAAEDGCDHSDLSPEDDPVHHHALVWNP